jgi:hypothetical protein
MKMGDSDGDEWGRGINPIFRALLLTTKRVGTWPRATAVPAVSATEWSAVAREWEHLSLIWSAVILTTVALGMTCLLAG